jgi:16S rRNA processing protein RimM
MSTRRRQRRQTQRRSSEHAAPSDAAAGAGDWIAVGEVVGAFGLRGELKVAPLTDFPERFDTTAIVYLGSDHTPYLVVGAHARKHQVVLRLEGVADAGSAEKLRGSTIWIPEAQRHPLARDQYYLDDLIGLEVRHVDGGLLGTVKDVLVGAGNDLLVVEDSAHTRETLLPLVKAFVKQVDLERRVVCVDPVAGLFDDRAEEAR